MRLNKTCALLAASAAFFAGLSEAKAALITWSLDSSLSSLSIGIPDQAVNLDGTAGTVRVRNQTGSSNTWNTGNKAAVQGTFNTNYSEAGGSLEFLNGADTLSAINSGNYRPNPAAFNSANTSTANPDGTFENTSLAPGVFGAQLKASVSILTVTLGYLNLYNVNYDVGSPVLALTGSAGTYTAPGNTSTFGIQSADIAVDGVSALIVGQVIPDTFTSFNNVGGTNGAPLISIVPYAPLGVNGRKMTIPVTITATTDLDGTPLTLTTAGTIVAYAIVPEPSTFAMAGFGLVSLGICARRRFRRR